MRWIEIGLGGATTVSEPSIAYEKVLQVWREGENFDILRRTVATENDAPLPKTRQVFWIKSLGKFHFLNPGYGELIYILLDD